ncbi:hypothetical protein LINPERPRIM_LOCUS13223 [Linum perenne]
MVLAAFGVRGRSLRQESDFLRRVGIVFSRSWLIGFSQGPGLPKPLIGVREFFTVRDVCGPWWDSGSKHPLFSREGCGDTFKQFAGLLSPYQIGSGSTSD